MTWRTHLEYLYTPNSTPLQSYLNMNWSNNCSRDDRPSGRTLTTEIYNFGFRGWAASNVVGFATFRQALQLPSLGWMCAGRLSSKAEFVHSIPVAKNHGQDDTEFSDISSVDDRLKLFRMPSHNNSNSECFSLGVIEIFFSVLKVNVFRDIS